MEGETPETPATEPILLRDGRRLWRFRAQAVTDRPPADAAALIDEARWHGAVLVADGSELVVVERWLSNLRPEARRALQERAGDIIATLRHRP